MKKAVKRLHQSMLQLSNATTPIKQGGYELAALEEARNIYGKLDPETKIIINSEYPGFEQSLMNDKSSYDTIFLVNHLYAHLPQEAIPNVDTTNIPSL